MWYSWVLIQLKAKPAPNRANTWRAVCPAHEDRDPSLSVWLGRKGNLLVGCHAGCDKNDVLRAAGLRFQDLFPPADGEGNERRRKRVDLMREVASYDYTDEDGEVLYQSVRYVPKSFKYRRPSPSGDFWVYNLEGVRLVPFQLHLLATADPKTTVCVCEGEKDALCLASLGLLSTTNCGGAGMGWLDSYSQALAGRRVVLFPHRDEQGKQHMDKVAGSLLRAGVSSLRVVELPVPKEHGDVADYLSMGGTRKSLAQLAIRAREWK
jgi:putative DNA primase/helicase